MMIPLLGRVAIFFAALGPLNRIGRRAITCMLLIAALALIWNA
jgi:hypothetical protein